MKNKVLERIKAGSVVSGAELPEAKLSLILR